MLTRDTVVAEHRRLRSLLEGILVLAAGAREGDLHAALQLAPHIDELRAELARHAFAEDVHIGPLLAPGPALRGVLDDAHLREARAAAALRSASGLGQLLEHVATIERALADEEEGALAG
jgi:hypothetical protein